MKELNERQQYALKLLVLEFYRDVRCIQREATEDTREEGIFMMNRWYAWRLRAHGIPYKIFSAAYQEFAQGLPQSKSEWLEEVKAMRKTSVNTNPAVVLSSNERLYLKDVVARTCGTSKGTARERLIELVTIAMRAAPGMDANWGCDGRKLVKKLEQISEAHALHWLYPVACS